VSFQHTYEQNLAQCIGAPQSADFFSLFLIPGPLSYGKRISPAGHSNAISNTIDQGSVVVLCRRVFLSAEIPDHPDMDRDLNYSGLNPTATTLIPDPLESASILHRTFPIASGSGIRRQLLPDLFYSALIRSTGIYSV